MRKKKGDLGESEWALMKICWEKGKVSAKDVYVESLKEKKRSYQTVKTIMDRLVEKDYLDREKFGPIWLYTPKVSQKDITSRAIDDFMKTVLGDTIAPIFSHFVKRKKKYKIDIDELKKVIEDMEEEE